MKLTTINIQGNIFTSEILEKIRQDDIRYQSPADFGLKPNELVRDEISNAWSLVNTYWQIFKQKRAQLSETDSGTSETRKHWILPLLAQLGYEIQSSTAEMVNEKSYAISHRASNKDGFPIHIVGSEQSLDKRVEHGVRLSPHALVQEYINGTDHIYGFVTNGLQFRVLRDATRLSRLSYLEFNLEQMIEEGHYAEFALFYRLLHASRINDKKEDGKDAILEFYHNEALASGSRIRENLSDAVYNSIIALGNGFVSNNKNQALLEQIANHSISAKAYYSDILKLVYRILFLNVIEERGLIYAEDLTEEQRRHKEIYEKYYSVNRLVGLVNNKIFIDHKKTDLWESLQTTFRLFESKFYGEKLSIAPLGFGLFAPNAISHLNDTQLTNDVVLKVISEFCFFNDINGQRVRVNYADLNVEELGSVYEGLLSLNPTFSNADNHLISFNFTDGTSRKESASYYTHHDLVKELVKSSLLPVLEHRLKQCANDKEKQKAVILDFKVCDPSVGSGHMLLEAARTLAYYYVKIDTDAEPTPKAYREAIRLVIQHCLYGVDMNPEAVELCKIALWLEGHSSGAPLSFLDHKIKVGNSLVGVHTPDLLLKGIPSDAFDTDVKEHKNTAKLLKTKNTNFLKSKQASLDFNVNVNEIVANLDKAYDDLKQIQQTSLDGVQQFKEKYEKIVNGAQWYHEWTRCNLWCMPFFANYSEDMETLIPTSETIDQHQRNANAIQAQIVGLANALAVEHKFFHWYLEFPEVIAKGGFDLLMGNPPWEVYELKETEFFTNRNNKIAKTDKKDVRTKLINQLENDDPILFKEFLDEQTKFSNTRRFINKSNRFPLTSKGKTNLYAIFAELFYRSINQEGRAGLVCPTGIATDDSTKDFFGEIVTNDKLVSFFDFENRAKLFPIDSRFKFCLLTVGNKFGVQNSKFGFFLHKTTDLENKDQIFELSKQDFININPNTKTTPIFRTSKDAELTSKVYSRIPVMNNLELNQNIWSVNFKQGLFNMTSDAHLFSEEKKEGYLPLYESKFIWHYDHRLGSFEGQSVRTSTYNFTDFDHKNPNKIIQPWYWIDKQDVISKTNDSFFIGFRNISNTTNERTAIFSLVPFSGVGHSMPLVFMESIKNRFIFLSQVSSVIFDFFVRQKLGGTNMTYGYVNQFPSLSPKTFTKNDELYLIPRVVELAYSAWDIKNAFDDLWAVSDEALQQAIKQQWEENAAACGGANAWDIPTWADEHPHIAWDQNEGIPLTPFRWDDARRLQLKAEIDAYYALMYGLEREELAYILDPKAVMGDDFPSESFRVLKEKEIKLYGEFRTQRLVLETYDRLRPHWDMPAHLQKLKEIWEFHQQDLSESKKKSIAKKKEKAPAVKKAVAKDNGYQAVTLFDEPNLFNQSVVVTEDCKVVLLHPDGKELPYHITTKAVKGEFTGKYKQVVPSSALALAMLGKGINDSFEFASVTYTIKEILS